MSVCVQKKAFKSHQSPTKVLQPFFHSSTRTESKPKRCECNKSSSFPSNLLDLSPRLGRWTSWFNCELVISNNGYEMWPHLMAPLRSPSKIHNLHIRTPAYRNSMFAWRNKISGLFLRTTEEFNSKLNAAVFDSLSSLENPLVELEGWNWCGVTYCFER